MKNYLIGAGVLVVAVALFFVGRVTAPSQPLGGYNPPAQSYAGFSQSLSTSSVLAATSFCSPTNIQYLGSSALVTSTLPAATSTYAACANFVNFGASVQGKIVNDSTNTVAFATATGDVFKCETVAAGTSTVGTGGTCTSSAFTLLASSTIDYSIFFDSSSSTLVFLVGNNYK